MRFILSEKDRCTTMVNGTWMEEVAALRESLSEGRRIRVTRSYKELQGSRCLKD